MRKWKLLFRIFWVSLLGFRVLLKMSKADYGSRINAKQVAPWVLEKSQCHTWCAVCAPRHLRKLRNPSCQGMRQAEIIIIAVVAVVNKGKVMLDGRLLPQTMPSSETCVQGPRPCRLEDSEYISSGLYGTRSMQCFEAVLVS